MSDQDASTPPLTLRALAQQLGITESDLLAQLNVTEVSGSVTVNSGTAHIVQGQNPTLNHHVNITVPPGTTVHSSAAKAAAQADLIQAAQGYADGVKQLKKPLDLQATIQEEVEALAYPVVQALERATALNVAPNVMAESLILVGTSLQSPPTREYGFDASDSILGRGAYLIVLAAFALAVVHQRFELLRVLIQKPIRWYGSTDFPLGGTRAYFFHRNRSGSRERDAFYDRLFNSESGWLTPFLPPRPDPKHLQVEIDFIGELAFMYAWRTFYSQAPQVAFNEGRFFYDLLSVKDFIQFQRQDLQQAFPDLKTLLRFMIQAYDAVPGRRNILASAWGDVVDEL